jgi:glycine oxidase
MSVSKRLRENETADVVIIGGGVIGLTIARALRQHGVREVMLIERGQPGTEASWAAGGILAPQVEADHADAFFRLACASRDLYPAFAQSLQEETGIGVELDTTGTLCVGFTPEHGEELRRRYEWQASKGLQVEWLSGDEARRVEPCLSASVALALRLPNDFQVENRRLVNALLSANKKLGVQLSSNCLVSALKIEREKVRGVETSLGFVATPIVVVAAGAWSSLIDSPGLPPIEIEPVRGQMLCFSADSNIAQHVIFSARGYVVPRRDGRVLAGSTAEHVGFDKCVTDDGIETIKAMAREISHAIAALPVIDSWAGFRPRAKDDLPVIGPCEEVEGLFYATGHYRNGILLAPITGEVIANAIVQAVTPVDLSAFSPDRFRGIVGSAAVPSAH